MKKGTHFSVKKPERFIYCVPGGLLALHILFVTVNIHSISLIPEIVAPTASLQNPVTLRAKITLTSH